MNPPLTDAQLQQQAQQQQNSTTGYLAEGVEFVGDAALFMSTRSNANAAEYVADAVTSGMADATVGSVVESTVASVAEAAATGIVEGACDLAGEAAGGILSVVGEIIGSIFDGI